MGIDSRCDLFGGCGIGAGSQSTEKQNRFEALARQQSAGIFAGCLDNKPASFHWYLTSHVFVPLFYRINFCDIDSGLSDRSLGKQKKDLLDPSGRQRAFICLFRAAYLRPAAKRENV